MHILQATSEFFPYSKTGGLADMVAGLSKALSCLGHEVSVVTPLYRCIPKNLKGLKPLGRKYSLTFGKNRKNVCFWSLRISRQLKIFFVEHDGFFNRPELYMEHGEGYGDNPERFILFSKAVVSLAQALDNPPKVIHCHDWQTGLVPALLRQQKVKRVNAPTCFTVHNMAYQGICDPGRFPLTNLPKSLFSMDGVEFHGKLNPLKAGLVFADRLTTVSPNYAREIMTSEFGEQLEGVLQSRQEDLLGILNGVDYGLWKTTGNNYLAYDYCAEDLRGKWLNQKALRRELCLTDGGSQNTAIFASIGRLTWQKGTGLLLDSMRRWLPENPAQFVILGSGDPTIENECCDLQDKFPDQVRACIGYDEPLAHRLEAAADFFVMPSLYEPCGLNQMYSLRYGSLPIVFSTGGLLDTVIDLNRHPRLGNGFTLKSKSTESLVSSYGEAQLLKTNCQKLNRIRRRAMKTSFNWEQSSKEYVKIYSEIQTGNTQ